MRFSDLLAAPTAIRLVALLGPALLAVPVLAQVDPGPASRGLVARVQKDSAAARVVSVEKQFEFGFVRIETREPGAELNSHPVRIEPAGLRAMLTEIQWPGAKPEQLFSAKELDQLVPPLSSALAHVTPEQEVSFAVSDQHSFMGPLASRVVTTGRVFRRDQALEIIFGLVRKDFESQFRRRLLTPRAASRSPPAQARKDGPIGWRCRSPRQRRWPPPLRRPPRLLARRTRQQHLPTRPRRRTYRRRRRRPHRHHPRQRATPIQSQSQLESGSRRCKSCVTAA